MMASNASGSFAPERPFRLAGPVRAGLLVSLVFTLTLFGWAGFAPVTGGVAASGIVSTEGSRRTIQHLEGGLVQAILVEEGQRVNAGDTLVQLAGTDTRARHLILLERERQLSASRMRLERELAGAADWDLAEMLSQNRPDDDAWARELTSQLDIFEQRRSLQQNREAALDQRIQRLNAEIDGLRNQIAFQDDRLGMLEEEIDTTADLFERGLVPRPRLLALRRSASAIEEERAGNVAAIARSERLISETESERLALGAENREFVAAELARVRTQLVETRERLVASRDALERTVIRAPVGGHVIELRSVTIGGVIRPGEPLLELVPTNEDPIIVARVAPIHIDAVSEGDDVVVRLPGLPRASNVRLEGVIERVSADVIIPEGASEAFYEVRVRVARREFEEKMGDASKLRPGTPAEILIVNNRRTVLAYLIEPLSNSFRRAFREE